MAVTTRRPRRRLKRGKTMTAFHQDSGLAEKRRVERAAKKAQRKPPLRIFVWTDKLALSVPEIDAQHKRWFLLTNAFLRKARLPHTAGATVQRFLAAAVAYAQKHFSAEEEFMRTIRVPDDFYRWHCMAHNAFVERVSALAERCRKGAPGVVEEMAAFMTGWLYRPRGPRNPGE